MNRFIKSGLLWLCLVIGYWSAGQEGSKLDKAIAVPDKMFGALDKKTSSIQGKLDKQTDKYLSKLQRQEHQLRKKVWRKDSVLAKQLFDGVDDQYERLKNKAESVSTASSVYSGHLDSLSTTLTFLNRQNLTDNPQLQKTLDQYKELQSKLNASEQIKRYITQRRELLKEQFRKLGMTKELKRYRKEVYYYQAQVKEYKELFENPTKPEEKLLSLAMKVPQFKDFFAQNSMLGSMFALPGSGGPSSIASLAGLQTRASVNQSLIDRFGSGSNVSQMKT